MICGRCEQTLRFDENQLLYVHPEGNLYVIICCDCGWKGAPYPSPLDCPKCGSTQLHDDHCAQPVPEKKR